LKTAKLKNDRSLARNGGKGAGASEFTAPAF